MKISGVVIAKNEESCIVRCIESMKQVCDEVIVVDGFSEDNTVELARSCGAVVYQHHWLGYSGTKNWGNSKAHNDWILSMDADEELSLELIHSIQKTTLHISNAYSMNRLNRFRDKWIRYGGWYPDVKIRLFNRVNAQWVGDFVHEQLTVESGVQIIHLDGDVLHFTTESEEKFVERNLKYVELKVQEKIRQGKKVGLIESTLGAAFELFKRLILKKGILDGYKGVVLALYHAKWKWARYPKYRTLKP